MDSEFATKLIERLELKPHPEGGWFKEMFRAEVPPGRRAPVTSILFMLAEGQRSHWHRIDTTELWYWQGGHPLELTIHEAGLGSRTLTLGDVAGGAPGAEALQAAVPPWGWQSAKPLGAWSLVGCAVAPGFDYRSFELAPQGWSPEQGDPRYTPLLDEAIGALGAESGTIHFLHDDGVLHLAASRGIPDQVLSVVRLIPPGKGMAGLSLERLGPVTACNIQEDHSGDVRPGAKATGLEGAIVVPIFDERDGAIGTIGVANRAARTFTPEETVQLVDFGRRLAKLRLAPASDTLVAAQDRFSRRNP